MTGRTRLYHNWIGSLLAFLALDGFDYSGWRSALCFFYGDKPSGSGIPSYFLFATFFGHHISLPSYNPIGSRTETILISSHAVNSHPSTPNNNTIFLLCQCTRQKTNLAELSYYVKTIWWHYPLFRAMRAHWTSCIIVTQLNILQFCHVYVLRYLTERTIVASANR